MRERSVLAVRPGRNQFDCQGYQYAATLRAIFLTQNHAASTLNGYGSHEILPLGRHTERILEGGDEKEK